MASTTTLFLLLFATLSTTTTTARPCKTIFFITSSSSHHNNNNNNNNNIINPPPRLTFFITEIRDFPRTTSFPRPMLFNHSTTSSSLPLSSLLTSLSSLLWLSNDVGTSEHPYIATSSTMKIRGRTMDVMSIVGAVIFGVGCGAITAVTMYLFWSLFAPRRFEFCSDSESGDEEEDERVDEDDHEGCFGVPIVAKAVPPSADEVDRIAGMK